MDSHDTLGHEKEREKIWRLWKPPYEKAVRWIEACSQDRLDLKLLPGGEELQKVIKTLPEEPT